MKLGVTNHAVFRYRERVKPAFDHEQARAELEALIRICGDPGEIPCWLNELTLPPSDGYIELSDGICAAVADQAVVTILTRAGSASVHRANKNEKKARRRKAKQAKRRAARRFKGSELKEQWQ